MPSPVGHALGGVLAALVVGPVSRNARTSRHEAIRAVATSPAVLIGALAGVLPDLDFLWGRHNMETHSLGAALLAAFLSWLWWRGQARLAVVVALAWASHVLFDWLGSDDTPPLGVMAFWPLSSSFHFAHAYVFEAISRRYWLDGFWPHNLWAVTTEVLLLGPPVTLLVWRRARQSTGRD